MISLDRTLLGADYSGDVLERHQEYARRAGRLDIIVFSKKGFNKKKISSQLTIYPSNSSTKLNYIFDAFEIAKKIYWPDKFDLIVAQDPFLCGLAGWLIKKRFKIPLLIHFHGDFWQNKYWLLERKRWWFNWFFLLLSKFLVDGADGIRVISSGIRDKLIKGGVDQNKIKVIPTPVDLKKFELFDEKTVKDLREKHHPDRKVIINVGRDDPSKDYQTLEKAIDLVFAKYRKLAFWQVGRGRYGDRLRKRIDEGLVLTSKPKIRQEELTNYYHASDVYVSSSCHESFGKVLIEAMAAGLPVVATATTGSQEIIQDGVNGFLVPIGDAEALARKILYLLNNPAKAKEMGEAGRKMVREKFNQDKIIKKMINFWKELK
jgi:glycosyltransferase involved in cell wall biosynthesis